jgi:hypothetical protein
VVVEASAVVSHRAADRVREGEERPEELFRREALEVRGRLEGGVQLVGVAPVMLRVMDLHRPGIDVGLQSVVRVPELGELVRVGHGQISIS